tara:strand:- start:4333 stop:4791 length:459 start_codon:yes stop_codon:yes gene_type:complete
MKTINSFFSNKILSEEKIEFDNKGRAKGYFALALDAKSRDELKKYAIHSNVKNDHVTIAYMPSEKSSKLLSKKLNKQFKIKTNELMSDDNIQAVTVNLSGIQRIDDGQPHITISHVNGVKPSLSNKMILKPQKKTKINHSLTGQLKFVRNKG